METYSGAKITVEVNRYPPNHVCLRFTIGQKAVMYLWLFNRTINSQKTHKNQAVTLLSYLAPRKYGQSASLSVPEAMEFIKELGFEITWFQDLCTEFGWDEQVKVGQS